MRLPFFAPFQSQLLYLMWMIALAGCSFVRFGILPVLLVLMHQRCLIYGHRLVVSAIYSSSWVGLCDGNIRPSFNIEFILVLLNFDRNVPLSHISLKNFVSHCLVLSSLLTRNSGKIPSKLAVFFVLVLPVQSSLPLHRKGESILTWVELVISSLSIIVLQILCGFYQKKHGICQLFGLQFPLEILLSSQFSLLCRNSIVV